MSKAVQIQLGNTLPLWPEVCACCNGVAEAEITLSAAMKVPFCNHCVKHYQVVRKLDSWPIALANSAWRWIPVPIAYGFIEGGWRWSLLGIPLLITSIASRHVGNKRAHAESAQFLLPDCASAYVLSCEQREGILTLVFDNDDYADSFAVLNRDSLALK